MKTLGRDGMMCGVGLSILTTTAVTGALLASLVAAVNRAPLFDDLPRVSPESALPELDRRLAATEAAIEGNDLPRAMAAWREAYGAAFRSRRWDAMASVGDAALRVDTLGRRGPAGRSVLLADARQAYLQAFFLARAAATERGIERVADAFASLGDAEVAVRARTALEASQ